MNEELQAYANSLYEQGLKESMKHRKDERTSFMGHVTTRPANLPISGSEVQLMARVQVAHIQRCMQARLHSYQKAFEESGAIPDDEALRQIWTDVQMIQENQVAQTARLVNDFAKSRGLEADFTESIKNQSDHAHDELLQEWKVWRSRTRLKTPAVKTIKHPHLTAGSEYQFHPAIEAVSRGLYNDGHFKSAVLEAFVCVINRVKNDSNMQAMDGDKLINHVFGPDQKGGPKLRFNSLASEAEINEQRGIMNLFKGIVGIRNFKAHSNTLFDSPERAFEYLALSSLLMRLLDIAHP
jgi:uncharacterized protein (TIGR02391 family)